MAWYSYTLTFALPADDAARVSDAEAIQAAWTQDTPFIHTASRNGVLLATLKAICEQTPGPGDIYLLQPFARLEHAQLASALQQLEALIAAIDTNPGVVVEATKLPHTPQVFLHSKEFEPLPAEMVYASDAIIKDGYVLQYTDDQVRQLLNAAQASADPRPSHDDDGESLEYVFNFLRSHVWLLRLAIDAKLVVVYGEMN